MNLSASHGLAWLRYGWQLFKCQPLAMISLVSFYFLLMMLFSSIPLIGDFLPLLLLPFCSVVFMQVCRLLALIQQKKLVTRAGQPSKGTLIISPMLFINTARALGQKLMARLLMLGALYLITIFVLMQIASLFDGGALALLSSGKAFHPREFLALGGMNIVAAAALLYLPVAMLFWFAPTLVAWQNMGVGKALFYSFFGVWRARGAFVVYGVLLLLGLVSVLLITTTILSFLFKNQQTLMLFMLPLSMVLTAMIYCTFYPSYLAIYGAAEEDKTDVLKPDAN